MSTLIFESAFDFPNNKLFEIGVSVSLFGDFNLVDTLLNEHVTSLNSFQKSSNSFFKTFFIQSFHIRLESSFFVNSLDSTSLSRQVLSG